MYSTELWYYAISLLSLCGYSLIALAIYWNNSLQVHPMMLIYYITLVDAALFYDIFLSHYICDLSLYKLFAMTVLYSNEI